MIIFRSILIVLGLCLVASLVWMHAAETPTHTAPSWPKDFPVVHLHCSDNQTIGDQVYLNYMIGQVTLATGGYVVLDISGSRCNLRDSVHLQGYESVFRNACFEDAGNGYFFDLSVDD